VLRSRQEQFDDFSIRYQTAVEAAQIHRYVVDEAVWIGRIQPQLLAELKRLGVALDVAKRPSDVTGSNKRFRSMILSRSFANQMREQSMRLLCELVLEPDGVVILVGVSDAERVLNEFRTGSHRPSAFGASGIFWGNSLHTRMLGPNSSEVLQKGRSVLSSPSSLQFLAWLEAMYHPFVAPWLCSRSLVVLRENAEVEACVRDWSTVSAGDRLDTQTIRELLGVRFQEFEQGLSRAFEEPENRDVCSWLVRLIEEKAGFPVDLSGLLTPAVPQTNPLEGERLLFVPDLCNEGWPEVILDFLTEHRGRADVELVVRVDIDEPELHQLTVDVLTGLVDASGIPESEQPGIVLELRALSEQERVALVSSCTGLVRSCLDTAAPTVQLALTRGLAHSSVQSTAVGLGRSDTPSFSSTSPASSRPLREDEGRPPVSVLIVTYNSAQTIENCLHALSKAVSPGDEVVIIDNASSDDTRELVSQCQHRFGLQGQLIHSDRNLGFSRGVNLAAERAQNGILLLLNPDTVVSSPFLDRMAGHLLSSETVGAVGATADYASGAHKVTDYVPKANIRGRSVEEVSEILASRAPEPVETKLLIGFCLMLERQAFEAVGGLPKQLFVGSDDLYLSWALRELGYKLLVAADVFVQHIGQVSFSSCSPAVKNMFLWQSQETLYEMMYARKGRALAESAALFGPNMFEPIRECISVVVLASLDEAATQRTLESLSQNTHRELEVIVVGPVDAGLVQRWSEANQIQACSLEVPMVVSRALRLNEGLAVCSGDYIACVGEGVELSPYWLANLLAGMRLDPDIGMVGPRMPVGTLDQRVPEVGYSDIEGFRQFVDTWAIEYAGMARPTTSLSTDCVLMTRACVEKVGGFDPAYWGREICDRDFGMRLMRCGLKQAVIHTVYVHSEPHPSEELLAESIARYDGRAFVLKFGGDAVSTPEMKALTKACALEQRFIHLPLSFAERCSPSAAPLPLLGPASSRVLLIPDWAECSWEATFVELAKLVVCEEQVSILVRVEPPDPSTIEAAHARLVTILEDLQGSGHTLPDVVLETTKLAPAERGSLYAAAAAFVPCGGRFDSLYRLEAQCVGVSILGADEPSDAIEETPELAPAK
jgi:GT2 family glycosyltransferase